MSQRKKLASGNLVTVWVVRSRLHTPAISRQQNKPVESGKWEPGNPQGKRIAFVL